MFWNPKGSWLVGQLPTPSLRRNCLKHEKLPAQHHDQYCENCTAHYFNDQLKVRTLKEMHFALSRFNYYFLCLCISIFSISYFYLARYTRRCASDREPQASIDDVLFHLLREQLQNCRCIHNTTRNVRWTISFHQDRHTSLYLAKGSSWLPTDCRTLADKRKCYRLESSHPDTASLQQIKGT